MLEEQINLSTREIISIERYMTGDGYLKISKRTGVAVSTVKYNLSYAARKQNHHNSKYHRISRRRYRQKFIRRLLRVSKCAMCGFNDPIALEFDHVNPKDKSAEISQLISKGSSMEKLKNEIRKCRIICANCHAKHTHMQQNSYKWIAFGQEKKSNE